MFKPGNTATWATLSLASFLFVAACGDTDPAPIQSDNNARPDNNGQVEPPTDSKLLHVTPCKSEESVCVVSLGVGANSELNVKLVDSNNKPVKDAAVKFELVASSTPAGIQLGSVNSFTNSEGIATVSMKAGNDPITAVGISDVIVSVKDPDIKKLRFTVSINAKDSANYQINPSHTGTALFSKVDALLFESDYTCTQLSDILALNGSLPTALNNRRGSVDGDRTILPIVFPSQPNGSKYTVIVKGYSEANENVEVVYGCADNNPAIENGISVVVDVELFDHIPNLKGVFNVSHSFDLRDTLPENIRRIVDIIGRVATDPGSFIVGCNAGSTGCPAAGSEGIINILADFLPDGTFSQTINDILSNNLVRGIVRDSINTLFNDWINSDSVPAWATNSVQLTQDIYETLRNFRVRGKIFFNEAPIAAVEDGASIGVIPTNSGRQLWNTVIFKWSRGCTSQGSSCGDIPLTANQIGVSGSAIEGRFDGMVFNSDKLRINEHTLSLNYGLLLMAVIERVVLPAIFGSDVDSVDAMLENFIQCDKLLDPSNSLYNTAKSLCTTLLTQASSSLRDYVGANLVYNGNERFLISTPVDSPCKLYQPTQYVGNTWQGSPLPYIQTLGEGDPKELQCKWEAKIKFSQGNVTTMGGRFYGEREGF